MRIKKIKGEFAEVETGRLSRTINIQLLPEIKVGEYVIVHAGFAIQRVNPDKAKQTLNLLNEAPSRDFLGCHKKRSSL